MSDPQPHRTPDPGEYQDKDIPDATTTQQSGSTGDEVPEGGDGLTDDVGEYTDTDVTSEHRPEPTEGGYTDTDPA